MHKNGICHRDLQPSNILYIPESKAIKIADFNVSKEFRKEFEPDSANAKMNTHTGEIRFRAPETFNCEEYT
jgi:serine/threonine protein kinase